MKTVSDNDTDWVLKVAFVRLDFPPAQRDTAQMVAAMFGEIIGTPILRLRPEHTLGEIFSWCDSASLDTVELIMALEEEFGREIDDEFANAFEQHTFKQFVEYLAASERENE